MPVDKFGRTAVGTSQRVVSGGVTLSQVNNTYLRRDGENTATADINLASHKLINVSDPANDQDAVTKKYMLDRVPLPYKKFLVPYATDFNTYIWKDYQSIPAGLTEGEFDDLPTGLYACQTGNIPATRLGSLPANTKGYLITLTYQQPTDRNKYYKWINSITGAEWEAYFKTGVWSTWVLSSKVSKSGDTMSGDLILSSPTDSSTFRRIGCLDVPEGKSFIVLLGNDFNKIYYDKVLNVNPVVMQTSAGYLVRVDGYDVMRIGKSADDVRTDVYQDIVMNQKFIADLHDPNMAQDAATKKYVDDKDVLKVNKSGDTMTGDLYLTTTTDSNITRNLGCKTIANGGQFIC